MGIKVKSKSKNKKKKLKVASLQTKPEPVGQTNRRDQKKQQMADKSKLKARVDDLKKRQKTEKLSTKELRALKSELKEIQQVLKKGGASISDAMLDTTMTDA